MNDELQASSACPICGQDTPHHHSSDQVAAYHDDQVRRDGWTSTLARLPQNSVGGLYLIRGHHIKVPKDDWHNVSYNAFQRVREGPGFVAEVAEWDGINHAFALLHWSGNARASGEEGRRPVYVQPTHWREIPPFGEPSDLAALSAQLGGLRAVVKDQRQRLLSLHTSNEFERERLVRELGEARDSSTTAGVVATAKTADGGM